MKKSVSSAENRSRDRDSFPLQARRKEDRRKVSCDGYTYIPMVGWFCRRKRTRRSNEGQKK